MSDKRTIKLLEAFSGVEEDLLERCERAVVGAEEELCGVEKATGTMTAGNQKQIVSLSEKLKKNFKKNSWRYGSAAAAVFCLIVVGVTYVSGLRLTTNDSAAFEAVMDEMTGGAAPENGAIADGTMMQDAASIVEMYQGTVDRGESESVSGTTMESADDIVESTNGMASGQMNVGNTAEKVQQENCENDAIHNSGEKSAVAEEKKDAITVRPEAAVTENGTSGGCKEFVYVTVTEADARAHEKFGAYVPVKVPVGYTLEGAYVSGEGEAESLMVSWSRGMDSVMVNITLPEEVPATVDVKKIETYDEYLYDIPHAETVPEVYREVFNNPVCAWEDFSLEFVQKRMISREDAGDTDTPGGNFSVLYPDGVLVYFNGRGTAEEIWELFCSMDANKQ